MLAIAGLVTQVSAQTDIHHTLNDQIIGVDLNIQASVLTNDGGVIAATEVIWHADVSDYGISLVRFDSQGNRVWNNFIYGFFNYTYALRSMKECPDGSIILIGNISAQSTAFLIKTSSTGNVLFAKTYARASTIILDPIDNGFIITGSGSVPAYPGYRAAYIAKTDANGNVLWSSNAKYASTENDYYHSAQRLADSSYVVVGTSITAASIYSTAILTRYDKNGVLLWTKGYVSGDMNGFMDVKEQPDGSFLIAGTKETYAPVGADPSSPIIVKTNANGNVTWAKTFGTGNDLFSTSYYQEFHTTFDNDAIYAGVMINAVSAPAQNAAILKIDTAGNLLWTRMFSTPSSAYGIFGIYNLSVKGSRLCFSGIKPLIVTDTTVQNAACYLKDTILTVTNITPTEYAINPLGTDTASLVTSYTLSVSPNVDLVKLEACGPANINSSMQESAITVYPNPAKDNLFIQAVDVNFGSVLNFELINAFGQVVKQYPIHAASTTIGLENLAPGIYFYRFIDQYNVFKAGKIIVQE